MICPICGKEISNYAPAKYLPHFYLCHNCQGYFNLEPLKPVYEETYFTEESKPTFLGLLIGKMLLVFPFLYYLKIKKLITPGGWILDYGCGNGKLVGYFAGKGLNAEGFDPSPSAVRLAKSKNIPVYGEIPEREYDLITFWHSLEHTDTPLKDLSACRKYLSKNGKILIAVPNGASFEARVARTSWFGYDWPYHRIHFTPKALETMLAASGFKILYIDYFNPGYAMPFLAQTFLNLFLPINAFYSMVTNRRVGTSRVKVAALGLFSIAILVVFSPVLLVAFAAALIMKRPGSLIVAAERLS